MSAIEAPTHRSFLDRLQAGDLLVADGATGTNYQQMGIEPGVAPEEWVFEHPERVIELHRQFIEAGSDLVLSCTFGGTPLRLADSPIADRTREVNVRAIELALEAAKDTGVLVAGSIGPTGQLLEPLGVLTEDEATSAFAEQAAALNAAHADLLVLETFFALEEALAAIAGAKRESDLPLVVCFSFDQGTRTMMGLSPANVIEAVGPLGVAAIGANCGRSLADTDLIVDEMLAAAGDLPLWIKPNAGVPHMVGSEAVYDAGPADLAAHAKRYADAGVRIVGGCCGSTPEHVAAIVRAIRG